MIYTLKQLLGKYQIIIPQIQRDYAQGRDDKYELRKKFLQSIKDVLTTDNASLKLDFVYGHTTSISTKEKAFMPLDGQQRLTTLWLLHWYMCPKVYDDADKSYKLGEVESAFLGKFTYQTRNSSRRFCEELIANHLISSNEKISSTIRNSPWFVTSWEKDPTVASILNMLDTIQELEFDETMYDAIVDRISFDYIDIKSEEFKLTDELYIKMNSRGKPLTKFENFKAQFSGILSASDTEYTKDTLTYGGIQIDYRKYFSFKIDGNWMDIFWAFAKGKKAESEIDMYIMNFFSYFAQMCYYKDNTNVKVEDYKEDFSIFKTKENISLLFKSLDNLHSIAMCDKDIDFSKIDQYFSRIFFAGQIDPSYNLQVRLSDNKDTNLFARCIVEGLSFELTDKILLFCLLAYNTEHNESGIKEYMRVLRNLLLSVRWLKETTYTPNIRINSFGNYYKLFRQLQSTSDIYNFIVNNEINNSKTDIKDVALSHEVEKAKLIIANPAIIETIFLLEEFKPLGGNIGRLKAQSNANITNYPKAIREIWENDDSLIIRALIASGFTGLKTKRCRLGDMYFFGHKGRWNTILTNDDSDFSESIISLLDNYIQSPHSTPEERLNSIIEKGALELNDRGWEYYFLKYPKMLIKSNYFAWTDDFTLRLLGSEGSNPLLAYHINPYVLVVSNLLSDTICKEGNCYAQYSHNLSGLNLNNGVALHLESSGWKIVLPDNYTLEDDILERYRLTNDLILKESNDKDRVEIAVDFCNDLY